MSLEKNIKNEGYLLFIMNLESNELFNVLVPGRKALAEVLSIMPEEKYILANVTIVTNPKDYMQFMNELITGEKPNDLNFGQFNF